MARRMRMARTMRKRISADWAMESSWDGVLAGVDGL